MVKPRSVAFWLGARMSGNFTFARGAPISIDRVVTDAGGYDLSLVTLEMVLKVAVAAAPPPEHTPVTREFLVTFTPATGPEPAFWRAALTGDIAPGDYITDGAFVVAGEVIGVTEPLRVTIVNSVTPA